MVEYKIRRFSTTAMNDYDAAMSMVEKTVFTNSADVAVMHAAALASKTEKVGDRAEKFVELMAADMSAFVWDYDGIRYSICRIHR